jgi:hypothetical protein
MVFHLFGSGVGLQFDAWNKKKKPVFKATEYSTLIMGVKKTCLKTSYLLRKSGMAWIAWIGINPGVKLLSLF